MTDLSDVNMEGVKPLSDAQELPVGQYLVRIEDTEKKETKEKFDESGNKMPPNYYLQISMQVYGGNFEGQTEFARLNLWNPNETAVRMAKSELKSIQEATGIVSTNSEHLHGKWMILEIKASTKDATKLYKHYGKADASLIEAFAHVPPVAAKAPSVAAHSTASTAYAATKAATAPSSESNALPSWAQKK